MLTDALEADELLVGQVVPGHHILQSLAALRMPLLGGGRAGAPHSFKQAQDLFMCANVILTMQGTAGICLDLRSLGLRELCISLSAHSVEALHTWRVGS